MVYDGFFQKEERFVNITIDNFDGGYQVGALFRQQGHKRCLCILDNDIGVDALRLSGFRKGFGESGAQRWIVPMAKEQRWYCYRQEIERFRQVTAVFAVSDFYAIDLIHFLQENGFSVPGNLCVAGFDDIPLCEMIYPTLTTVKQDTAMRAKLALEKLRALKENRETETTIMLPVELVERGSTRWAEAQQPSVNMHKTDPLNL